MSDRDEEPYIKPAQFDPRIFYWTARPSFFSRLRRRVRRIFRWVHARLP